MILQSIAWPDRIEDRELFYRSESSVEIDARSRAFRLGGEAVRFDTYFNAFSLIKWRKYTRLGGVCLRLELKGDAEITLLRHDLRGEIEARPASWDQPDFEAVSRAVRVETFSCEDFQPVELAYADCDGADGLSFAVRPLSAGTVIRQAAYCAGADTPKADPVDLALAICTYKREDYVAANMGMLQREIFDNPDALLHGHLRVYIADNGQSLDAARFDGRHIRVFPNVNSGGSGGFSRAAIEAVHDASFPATHVVLMDDDISFNPWALERNYTFLSLIKPEYRINLLGGAMLNADYRHLMYAAGERFTLQGIKNDKEEWDLRDLKYVLLGETDIPVNYYAWWYCCIPVPLLKEKQYSLPFFVQFDDIEFSLRCGDVPKICLNGLCCWHNPLEHKETDARYYYNYRNFIVMDILYYPEFDARRLKKILVDDCYHMIFTYSFRRAHLIMRGIEDFLKGPDWPATQDPAALNREVIAASDRVMPADQLPVAFDPERVLLNDDINQNQLKRRLRWITLNGWLLPAKRKPVVVEKFQPPMQYFFRAGTVVKYDVDTRLALVTKRSYREALGVLRHMRSTLKAIDAGFDRAADAYRARHGELCSEAFWRKFLKF
ncbi:MAG: glycosyltransferase [Clostridia bacterium]|nr:glycosyltransferase [Clostridia bacterium]